MNAYLTSSAQSAALLSAAGVAASSSALSNASLLLRSDADLGRIEADLRRCCGGDRVVRMSRDVLVYRDSHANIVQRLPGEGEPPVLDFTGLASSTSGARPIVLFQPGLKRRFTTFTGWMEALRLFGYDIRAVGKHAKFREALEELAPDIICLSATEHHIDHLAQAYKEIADRRPGAVTLLGGYAAYPSAADFFDVVVPGEGDLVLPLLLRFLQNSIAAGEIPTDSGAEGGMLPSHLPAAASDGIRVLAARRVATRAGSVVANAVDSGSHLYIRGRKDNLGLHARLSGGRDGWPIPLSDVELKTLWRVPESDAFGKGMIYTQRGCKPTPDGRCFICSVTSPGGRRMDPGDAVDAIKEFRSRGASLVMFADENFSQKPSWTHELLDGIEREGLFRDLRILMQMRADTWREDLVHRLWDMGVLVGVGFETMHPRRAERLGKVREGKGERYVARATELLGLGSEYARGNGAWLRDMFRGYMILSGIGDTLSDVLDDMLVQFRLMRELAEFDRGLPWLSYNLAQIVHAHSRAFEEMGDEEKLRITSIDGFDGHLHLGEETEVDMGPFTGVFYPFHLDDSGMAHGIVRPREFKMDAALAKFISLMRKEIYGGKKPSGVQNPEVDRIHASAIVALSSMMSNDASLLKALGSRDAAETILNEMVRLYAKTYPGSPR